MPAEYNVNKGSPIKELPLPCILSKCRDDYLTRIF